MFTLLMANIQRETLICVSNSDREGAWTQLHLQDRDTVVSPSQVCPSFPGPNVGFGCDTGPRSSSGGLPGGYAMLAGDRGGLLCMLSIVCTDFNGGLLF